MEMEGKHNTVLTPGNTYNDLLSTTRPGTFGRAKVALAQFVRKTLHHRHPSHMRTSRTGRKGYRFPAEHIGESYSRDGLRSQSSNQLLIRTRPRTQGSVLSITSLEVSGETPNIMITRPSAKGRRSYIIHRGYQEGEIAPPEGNNSKRIRYSHPTATAVIHSASWEAHKNSRESLLVPDNSSRLSTPKTVDLAREFPGEVNVRQIAHDKDFAYEDAKAVVDGVKQRESIVKLTSKSGLLSGTKRSSPSYSDTLRVAHVNEDEAYIEQHRQQALAALSGTHRIHQTPASLRPGPLQCFVDVDTSSEDPSREGESWLEDSSSPSKSVRGSITTRDSLNFIPYSKFIERKPTVLSKEKSTVSRLTVDYQRHRQLYASVENLSESFPAFDEALSKAMLEDDRLEAEKDALLAANAAAAYRKSLIEPHKMNDSGFPIFKRSHTSLVSEAKCQKRTPTPGELEIKKKAEKRKSKIDQTKQEDVQARVSIDSRRSLIGKLRAGVKL